MKTVIIYIVLLVIMGSLIFYGVSYINNENEKIDKYNESLRINALKKKKERHAEYAKEKVKPIEITITGVIEDIKPVGEDSSYVSLFIFFKDGRIIQLRTFYGNSLIFHRNKINIITYNRIRKTIYKVEEKE